MQFGEGGEINFSVSVHVFIIKILSTILYLLYVQCKLSQEPFFFRERAAYLYQFNEGNKTVHV